MSNTFMIKYYWTKIAEMKLLPFTFLLLTNLRMKYQNQYRLLLLATLFIIHAGSRHVVAQVAYAPANDEINRPFGDIDKANFLAPPKVYYPETWFHYIG